jgi:hypothetical protein
MTHDVEADAGKRFCSKLMDLNQSFGIPASLQIVPENRYSVEPAFLAEIRDRGFEVNIHDLNHDGKLCQDGREFERRIEKINKYAAQYARLAFAQPCNIGMQNGSTRWSSNTICRFRISPIWTLSGGCCTGMPYFIGRLPELPLTTIQDHSLFNLLNDFTMKVWELQTNFIVRQNGLLSFIVHPDYIRSGRHQDAYKCLLNLLR